MFEEEGYLVGSIFTAGVRLRIALTERNVSGVSRRRAGCQGSHAADDPSITTSAFAASGGAYLVHVRAFNRGWNAEAFR